MRTTRPTLSRSKHTSHLLLICLLFGAMVSTSACDREPGILVNIASWPAGVERIRVGPTIEGKLGKNIIVSKDQTRFVVRLPIDATGVVQLDAIGIDNNDCKTYSGNLNEYVPKNLSLFAERTLELSPLPAPVCAVFKDAINISTDPSEPHSVAVGDFDSDGTQDLAIANAGIAGVNQGVTVLLGNGLGGFGKRPKLPNNFSEPKSVVAADFKGDMKLDLAVANFGGGNVSVLRGNALGDFDTVSSLPVAPYPQSVAVGDFNGDMIQDLASSNAGDPREEDPLRKISTVSVMLGNGLGIFSPAMHFPVDAVGAHFVAVGDFNRDSYLDLAVANAKTNNISVLLGNGRGAFGTATTFAVGYAPYWLAVGDFNRDSYPDLAVANYGLDATRKSSVSVLLGNGLGKFAAALNFLDGGGSRSLAVGDFDGDLNPDIAVANTADSNVSLLLGNGLGGFSPATIFKTGTSPRPMAVGDFNGDRLPDLAVANVGNSSVSILLNQF